MKINLVYGSEFWIRLHSLTKNAKRRIFVFSAFVGKSDYENIYQQKSNNIPIAFMCRRDSKFQPEKDVFLIDSDLFHGKIYVVDDVVLIGSQNLYNANKEGEFSVEFESSDSIESSLIVYQALLKTFKPKFNKTETVHEKFLEFYGDSCPFCGHEIEDPDTIINCKHYGSGFATEIDCDSYDGTGACKYCLPQDREYLGECLVCGDSGCGFGVEVETKKLIHHIFVNLKPNELESALSYIQLFNYFAHQDPIFAFRLFDMLGFNGQIFKIPKERLSWQTQSPNNCKKSTQYS